MGRSASRLLLLAPVPAAAGSSPGPLTGKVTYVRHGDKSS
jgi:hypothetical protein